MVHRQGQIGRHPGYGTLLYGWSTWPSRAETPVVAETGGNLPSFPLHFDGRRRGVSCSPSPFLYFHSMSLLLHINSECIWGGYQRWVRPFLPNDESTVAVAGWSTWPGRRSKASRPPKLDLKSPERVVIVVFDG